MTQITSLLSTCGAIASLVMNTTHQKSKKKKPKNIILGTWILLQGFRGWATRPICCVLILGLYSGGSRGLNDPPPREKTQVQENDKKDHFHSDLHAPQAAINTDCFVRWGEWCSCYSVTGTWRTDALLAHVPSCP